MKRSKIFLGVTTGVLAVVAFTAAKSAKFTTRVHGYITRSSSLKCTLAVTNEYYTVGQSNTSGYAKTSTGGRTIFEYQAGSCLNPLYTQLGND